MIHCENCGQKLEDDASFCAECGHQVGAEPSAQSAKPTDNTSNAEAKTKANATSQKGKTPAPKNKKTAIIAGVCAAAVAIIAVVAFVIMGADPISGDQLKSDVAASDFATKGVVASNYVNDSPYEITELKSNEQQKSTQNIFGMQFECVTVSFTGTMQNANFKTEFSGQTTYAKDNGKWQVVSDPSVTTSTTTPLKGVDFIESNANVSSNTAVVYSTSDFASTLDGSAGAYTSTATQKVSYDMWFATDIATSSATFAFDDEKGWQMQGNAELTDKTTTWKLSGKTFEMQSSSSSSTLEKNSSSTLKFVDSDKDTLSAQWTFVFTAPQSSSQYEILTSLDLGGTATGSPVHEFGADSFSVTLADPSNGNASFECTSTTTSPSSGEAVINSLKVNIDTDNVWREWTGTSFGDSTKRIDLSYTTFTEKA